MSPLPRSDIHIDVEATCLTLPIGRGTSRSPGGRRVRSDVILRHPADRLVHHVGGVTPLSLAFGARSVPLDRVDHGRIDPDTAPDGLEAMSPAVIRVHADVVHSDRADPGGQTLTNLLVDRVRGLPVPSAGRVVEEWAGSATEDEFREALLDE